MGCRGRADSNPLRDGEKIIPMPGQESLGLTNSVRAPATFLANGHGDITGTDLIEELGHGVTQTLRLMADSRANEKEKGDHQQQKQEIDRTDRDSTAMGPFFHARHGGIDQVGEEDGEKEGRDRDTEFTPPVIGKTALLALWEEGWTCLLDTLHALKDEDLLRTITIRHEPLIVVDAINRQLAHYPHHVGQIVYIGKMIRDQKWQSLSIPRGASGDFNQQMRQQHTGDDR